MSETVKLSYFFWVVPWHVAWLRETSAEPPGQSMMVPQTVALSLPFAEAPTLRVGLSALLGAISYDEEHMRCISLNICCLEI